MRLNRVTITCLVIAGLLTGGVLIAQAYGFVSYEVDPTDPTKTKMILWDNARIAGHDLNFPPATSTTSGSINIGVGERKDLYIRKFIGFGCPDNYPSNPNCIVQFGDTSGNIFMKINQINNIKDLHLISERSGLVLLGDPINLGDQASNKYQRVIISDGKNLIATDIAAANLPSTGNSVYADNLRVNEFDQLPPPLPPLADPGLTINNLKMSPSGYFITERIITYTPPTVSE
ncbi:MAG: hypothetical protein NTX00_03335 [Candidatus Parcubacteria bacterium]|nr:hypothetical protein [Candidatus Parcubacteria bacterium]